MTSAEDGLLAGLTGGGGGGGGVELLFGHAPCWLPNSLLLFEMKFKYVAYIMQ